MDTRTDENEQQPTEMQTLQRQLNEQLAESSSRVFECSQLRSQIQETRRDEIIKVPNGDACLNVDEEKCLRVRTEHSSWEDERNSQSTSIGRVCSELLSRVPEVITENGIARVLTNIDDEFVISRQ